MCKHACTGARWVCLWFHVYSYIHIEVWAYMWACWDTSRSKCEYIDALACTCASMHIHMCIHAVCVHTCICAHVHECKIICVHRCLDVHDFVCTCVSVHMCMCANIIDCICANVYACACTYGHLLKCICALWCTLACVHKYMCAILYAYTIECANVCTLHV